MPHMKKGANVIVCGVKDLDNFGAQGWVVCASNEYEAANAVKAKPAKASPNKKASK